jgi:hypothetical protein
MAMEQHLHEQTTVHRDDLGGPRAESDQRRLSVTVVEDPSDDGRAARWPADDLCAVARYQLENLAYKALPDLLARDYGLHVEGRLKRDYVIDNRGRAQEINILGKARRNGDEVTIVGESKAQLSKNDIDRFLRRRLELLIGVVDNPFPVLVTHMASEPDVEAYAQAQNVALYYSYDF